MLLPAKRSEAASATANPAAAKCARMRVTGRGTCLLAKNANVAGMSAAVPTTLDSIAIQRGLALNPTRIRNST